MSDGPSYYRVFAAFARNSLVRDMTFRANFLIEAFTSLVWMLMNLGFYILIYRYTREISDWDQYQFFCFLATTMFVNSLVQTFFMPNAEEFSEQIRSGRLDFALLKPIDTQFLVSCARIEWSGLSNFLFGIGLLAYALYQMGHWVAPVQAVLYPLYVMCGVAILYSLMAAMAAASIWLGRNQSLYDFWFYITNFSRYPMEIYSGPYGTPLQWFFTFCIPVLVVVNVPARLVAKTMTLESWWLAGFALLAAGGSLLASRWVFQAALERYRSASS
jgi:ABC-2 type transport system permease protein